VSNLETKTGLWCFLKVGHLCYTHTHTLSLPGWYKNNTALPSVLLKPETTHT